MPKMQNILKFSNFIARLTIMNYVLKDRWKIYIYEHFVCSSTKLLRIFMTIECTMYYKFANLCLLQNIYVAKYFSDDLPCISRQNVLAIRFWNQPNFLFH